MIENLESNFGITQSLLQLLVLAGVGALFIGTYWRTIAGGLVVLFIIYIFIHDPNGVKDESEQIPRRDVSENQSVVSTAAQLKNPESVQVHDEFMADCTMIAANDRQQCEEIWRETEPPSEE